MGEFAKDRIYSLINFLGKEENNDNKKVMFEYAWNEKDALNFIELIGEPILKSTLREMYFARLNEDGDYKIDKEIERLNKLRKNR